MKKFDTLVEEILGGVSDGMTPQDIADKYGVPLEDVNKQLNIGKEVEKEHTKTDKDAQHIAKDHLFELGLDYYSELAKMEGKLRKNER